MQRVTVREQIELAIRSRVIALEAFTGERVNVGSESSVLRFLEARGLALDGVVLQPRIQPWQRARWMAIGAEVLKVVLTHLEIAGEPRVPDWLCEPQALERTGA